MTPPHIPSLEQIAEQVVRQFMRADGSQAQLQAAILSALCAVHAEGYESGFSDGCGGAGAEAIDAAFAALKDATGGEYSHEDHIVIDGLLAARGAFAQIERLERLLRESDRVADWLDEIEAQADETSPYYLPRLIKEVRRLRAAQAEVEQERDTLRQQLAEAQEQRDRLADQLGTEQGLTALLRKHAEEAEAERDAALARAQEAEQRGRAEGLKLAREAAHRWANRNDDPGDVTVQDLLDELEAAK